MRALFSNRLLYVGWAAASAAGLIVSAYIDPYVFGATSFTAAFLSGVLLLGAAALNWRKLLWAGLACIPTAWAFAVLSTYNWA